MRGDRKQNVQSRPQEDVGHKKRRKVTTWKRTKDVEKILLSDNSREKEKKTKKALESSFIIMRYEEGESRGKWGRMESLLPKKSALEGPFLPNKPKAGEYLPHERPDIKTKRNL